MLLPGKPIAEMLKAKQTERIAASGKTPQLCIIQAGDNLASTRYIGMKKRYGEDIGAKVIHEHVGGEKDALQDVIEKYNDDPSTHGIIVQLPLPDPSFTDEVTTTIDPDKDVDGLGSGSNFYSATAMAVIALLDGYEIPINGSVVAMVGYGRLVGRPLTELLRERGAEVAVCDIDTKNVGSKTLAASVVISATGVGGMIKGDMVKNGSVVIDVGTSEDQGSIVGDVAPELLENDSVRVTPAKGGIGPITVSVLFEQLLRAADIQ